jgi:hypothetical protein
VIYLPFKLDRFCTLKKANRKFYDSQNMISTFSKIDQIQNSIEINTFCSKIKKSNIDVDTRMRPKGRGFESPLGKLIMFQIKHTPKSLNRCWVL